MLKLTTDRHEASRGLFATAEPLVLLILYIQDAARSWMAKRWMTLLFCRHVGMNDADIWRSGGRHQLYVLGSGSVTPACLRIGGLSPRQTKFCQLYPDHMASIGRGARMAIAECQWQFRYRRWNCSTVEDNSVFGPVIDRGISRGRFAIIRSRRRCAVVFVKFS